MITTSTTLDTNFKLCCFFALDFPLDLGKAERGGTDGFVNSFIIVSAILSFLEAMEANCCGTDVPTEAKHQYHF